MRAVVIYSTCEGQTQRIAQRIAETMTGNGVPSDTFDVTRHDVSELAVESYQAVVLGSSLHCGEHDPRIAWCMRQHAEWLRRVPTAFFSISLGIISSNCRDRKKAEWLAGEFLRQNGFNPSRRACFAGALRYSKYGWLKKQMMHSIAERSGSPTQTDRDYEYTDWDAVRVFASEFARLVHSCKQPEPNHGKSPCLRSPSLHHATVARASV